MKAIKKIFIFINVLLFLATILSYIAPYVNPTKAWIFPFFATSFFWLLLANLLFITVWALFKSKIWLLSLLALLLGIQHLGSYFSLSFNNSKPDDISIMTYNTGGAFNIPEKKTGEEYKAEFTALLEDQDKPKILCLQESAYPNFFINELGYPFHHRTGSTILLTKYKILDKGKIKFEDTSNRIVWADLDIHGKTLRVINMHLQSNHISSQTEDLIKHPDLAERKTWSNMKSVIRKIKLASQLRSAQAIEAKAFIDASPHPTLVVGDFNDTPLSYTYTKLIKNYSDAFKKSGNGIGITYAGSIPGLRIDYILGSEDIKFKKYACPSVALSDHYPVIGHFAF